MDMYLINQPSLHIFSILFQQFFFSLIISHNLVGLLWISINRKRKYIKMCVRKLTLFLLIFFFIYLSFQVGGDDQLYKLPIHLNVTWLYFNTNYSAWILIFNTKSIGLHVTIHTGLINQTSLSYGTYRKILWLSIMKCELYSI